MNIQALTEKYRPKALNQIRGQDFIVKSLSIFAKNPAPKAFLFSGPSGCGKTSAAYALARELGCDVDKKEWGGLHEIASGECTAENIREMFNTTMRFSTWHGSGWKVVIVNEADNMSDKAGFLWLDILEKLPAHVVVVFTTNDATKFKGRFASRCERYRFNCAAKGADLIDTSAELAAQALIDDVWQTELGHNHSPKLAELDGWLEDGNVNFRAVIQALEPRIRVQREIDGEAQAASDSIHKICGIPPAPACQPTKKPCIRVALPVKAAPVRVAIPAKKTAYSEMMEAGKRLGLSIYSATATA